MKLSTKTNDNPTFLICRLSSLGDVALTTAITRQISNAYPNSKIYFVTGENFTEIYRFHPHVRGVFSYKRDFTPWQLKLFKKEILQTANVKRFDYFIDLQNNRRSRELRENLAVNTYEYDKNRLFKLCLVLTKRALKKRQRHVVELYRTALSKLNVPGEDDGLELYGERGRIVRQQSGPGRKIVICPGAKHFTKSYPPEKYAKAIDMLAEEGYEVTINAAEFESEAVKSITGKTRSTPTVRLTNSILEMAQLFSECDVAVTNDSAAAHIAAACKLPSVVVYGSTVPEFGFTPYKAPYEAVINKVECQPCTHIGRDKCPLKHFNCMNGIDPSEILIKVRLLNK